jgi:hypothetical protein
MEIIVLGIVAVASILLFALVMRNFRKQRDFEGTGRTPPEKYD